MNPIISTEVQEDKDDYKTLFSKRKDFKDIFNQKDLTKQKPPKVAAFSQFDRVCIKVFCFFNIDIGCWRKTFGLGM